VHKIILIITKLMILKAKGRLSKAVLVERSGLGDSASFRPAPSQSPFAARVYSRDSRGCRWAP
jgi:hypothetical protein